MPRLSPVLRKLLAKTVSLRAIIHNQESYEDTIIKRLKSVKVRVGKLSCYRTPYSMTYPLTGSNYGIWYCKHGHDRIYLAVKWETEEKFIDLQSSKDLIGGKISFSSVGFSVFYPTCKCPVEFPLEPGAKLRAGLKVTTHKNDFTITTTIEGVRGGVKYSYEYSVKPNINEEKNINITAVYLIHYAGESTRLEGVLPYSLINTVLVPVDYVTPSGTIWKGCCLGAISYFALFYGHTLTRSTNVYSSYTMSFNTAMSKISEIESDQFMKEYERLVEEFIKKRLAGERG